MSAQGGAGFFTLGVSAEDYDLPHPSTPLPILFVIRRVILRAFEILRAQGAPFAASKEDEITVALFNIIENDLRQKGAVPGFDRRRFEPVARHACVENYDGTKLKKEPDLCFKLRRDGEPARVLSAQDGLFVECKPVDESHAAGGEYCDKGLQRFVNGDYAWAMQDALMLAYVRHGRSIAEHLVPAMSEPERRATLKVAELPRLLKGAGAKPEPEAEAVYCSRHRRGFLWPHEKGAAVDIVIYHFWHRCT